MRGMHTQLPANRLRELREAHGHTLLDAAAICEVYPSTISRWETGLIPQQHLPVLASWLGTDVPYLAGWADSPRAAAA
jgi:transcriptional regulator with XRE-family HTH domain